MHLKINEKVLKMRKVLASLVKMLSRLGRMASFRYSQNLTRSTSTFAMAKPYDSIPTPESLDAFGDGYLNGFINKTYLNIIEELGPLFKLDLFGVKYLVVADPEDAKVLHFNEGKFPKMPSNYKITGFQR